MTDTTAAANGTEITDAGTATTDSTSAVDTTTQTGQAPASTETSQTPAPVVPEVYEFEMPEGVELDKDALNDFTGVAKELKLDQAAAQKLADVGVKMAQRQKEVFENTKAAWAEQARTDKDIGGEKFEQNLAMAKKTLETFGSPELKEILNVSGLGNHPVVIKFLVNTSKAISEDGFVTGTPAGGNTDLAKKLFPSMN